MSENIDFYSIRKMLDSASNATLLWHIHYKKTNSTADEQTPLFAHIALDIITYRLKQNPELKSEVELLERDLLENPDYSWNKTDAIATIIEA